MAFAKEGKAVQEFDHKGHVALYAQLSAAYATAATTGKRWELDRIDILRVIINHKIPHLKRDFWKKDDKRQLKGQPRMGYADLMEMVERWINILNSMGASFSNAETVEVAAATMTTETTFDSSSSSESGEDETYAETLVD